MELISMDKDLRSRQQTPSSVMLMVHLLALWFPEETEAERCCMWVIVLNRPSPFF